MENCIRCGKAHEPKENDYSFCEKCRDKILFAAFNEQNIENKRKEKELADRAERARQEALSQSKREKELLDKLWEMPYSERLTNMERLKIKVKYMKPDEEITDFKNVYKALEKGC